MRGGNFNNDINADAFNSNNNNGNDNNNNSWRSVLVPGDYNIIKLENNFHSVIMFTDIMVMHIVETLFLFGQYNIKIMNKNVK